MSGRGVRGAWLVALLVTAGLVVAASAQAPSTPAVDPLHEPFDQVLDLYVRDGYVYYGALKQERARFDRYVSTLAQVPAHAVSAWTPPRQLAFWINAYNALVLETVIDHYPIRGGSSLYPPDSIRQVPGAFESATHTVAGRALTLDAIERDVIAGFRDPRALLALGRGAIGGGRLRSEAFTAEQLYTQLSAAAAEVVAHRELVQVDPTTNELRLSPLFSWREAAFADAWQHRAPRVYAQRSPIERAVLALIDPVITRQEAAFLEQNRFQTVFGEFDWRLNDLSTRR